MSVHDVLVCEFAIGGLAGEERDERRPLRLRAIVYAVVRIGHRSDFLTCVVPCGHLTARAVCRFVDPTALRVKIKTGIEVRNAIEQDRGLVRVLRVACHGICRAKIDNSLVDQFLPLTEDNVVADEAPAMAVGEVPVAVIHAKQMKRVGRVGVVRME